MEIAKSIIADRTALGITQDQLAAHLGVTQQAVSGWEEGKSVPRADRLHIMAALFGPESLVAMCLRNGKRRRKEDKDREAAIKLLQEAIGLLTK